MVFNICCPYTSRDDITHAIRNIAGKVENNELDSSEIDIELLQRELHTGQSPPLDILVRTSGATRLSDFMLWESNIDCQIEFVTTLWPDFSVWELYRIILKWSFEKSKEYE